MNILSLFDGMSCGQIAINRLGIKYDNYFASEIQDAWQWLDCRCYCSYFKILKTQEQ